MREEPKFEKITRIV